MKKMWIITIVSLLVIVAVLTNPNKERHLEVLRSEINSAVQKSLSEEPDSPSVEYGDLGDVMGLVVGGLFVNGILNNIVSIDNYVLFSLTRITWEGNSIIIGIGLFGNVFLTDKIDDAINKIEEN